MQKNFVTALLFLALLSYASAATYYLDAEKGNDSWQGTSEQPWKTIAKALSNATSGDTVIMASGTYDAFIDLKPDRSNWLTFQTADGAKPELPYIKIGSTGWKDKNAYLHLKGLRVISNQIYTGGNRIFSATSVNYVKLQDCYLYGYKRYLSIGVLLENVNNVTLEHCEIFYDLNSVEYFPNADSADDLPGKTRGVELNGNNITIQGCYIHDMASSGIMVSSASTNVLIQDTHVANQHSAWPGSTASDGVHGSGIALLSGNVTINRCIIRGFGNTREIGIYAGSGTTNNLIIENCLFYDITAYSALGFATGGYLGSGCKFNHNTVVSFWQSAAPSSNCERYNNAIGVQWDANYSGDFEFYNNLIIGKVSNSISSAIGWYNGQYFMSGIKVSVALANWINGTSYAKDKIISLDSRVFNCISAHVADTVTNKPLYGSNWTTYWEEVGSSYFRCKLGHTAVTADNKPGSGTNWTTYWDLIDAALVSWTNGTSYAKDEIISLDGRVFKCINAHVADTVTNKPLYGSNRTTYWEYAPGRIWNTGGNIVFSYLYPGSHTLYDLHYNRLSGSTVLCSRDAEHGYGWMDKLGGWDPEADFFVADTPEEMLLSPPGPYYTTADFRLKANSPAINYGDVTKAIATGKSLGTLGPDGFIKDDGITRDATHHSAGAYEFQSGTQQTCSGTDTSCGNWPNCANCNALDSCIGNINRDYRCSAASCTYTEDSCTDCTCNCGDYNATESIANNNCSDAKDNDCDGTTDSADSGCQAECVDLAALTNYIGQWKQGNITMLVLMQKIALWKAGTGCGG